jgi:antitoxin YobK
VSLDALERALRIVRENPGSSTFVGPRADLFVRSAEQALGLCFPPSYRRFTLELGAGNVGATEIFGVVDMDFELSTLPDAVWLTLKAREESDCPADLILIGASDDELICLQVRADRQEGPVLALSFLNGDHAEGARVIAADFGTYFLAVAEVSLSRETG